MMIKRPLPLVAGAALLLASGTLVAAAQSEQRQAVQGQAAQGQAVQDQKVIQPNAVLQIEPAAPAQSVPVGRPTDGNALPRPQNRVATLTIAECEGLGGKVVDVDSRSCPWTGKMCYTADKDGVIRKACITMAPS